MRKAAIVLAAALLACGVIVADTKTKNKEEESQAILL